MALPQADVVGDALRLGALVRVIRACRLAVVPCNSGRVGFGQAVRVEGSTNTLTVLHVEVFSEVVQEARNLVARLDTGEDEDRGRSDVAHLAPEGVVGMVRVLIHRKEASACGLHAEHDRAQHTRDHDDVLRHPEARHCAEDECGDLDVRVAQVLDEVVRHGGHEHAPQDAATCQPDERNHHLRCACVAAASHALHHQERHHGSTVVEQRLAGNHEVKFVRAAEVVQHSAHSNRVGRCKHATEQQMDGNGKLL